MNKLDHNTELKRFELFFKEKEKQLIQLYITERKKHNNELGTLILFMGTENVDVNFYPISSPQITEELRNDLISKNNHRNSFAFFILVHHSLNITNMIVKDLEEAQK